jgi:hypothetical protein
MEKCEGRSMLQKHIHKCEHNIKMYLKINRVERVRGDKLICSISG